MSSSAQWQADLVQQWQDSGESADVFAKRHKFRPEALIAWAARFDRQKAKCKTSEKLQLVPVAIVADEASGEELGPTEELESISEASSVAKSTIAPCGLVIEIGKLSVRVQRGFDSLLLKQVIEVLGDC